MSYAMDFSFAEIENVPDLTEEERVCLKEVIKKAKEFEDEEDIKSVMFGPLYKYTNVIKGWQRRWFAVIPEFSMLEYHMNSISTDQLGKLKPRGAISLVGAVIVISEEDDLSFSVTSANGDVYKLKAMEPIYRKFWVNKLQLIARQPEPVTETLCPMSKVPNTHCLSQPNLTTGSHFAPFNPLQEKRSLLTKTNSLSDSYLPPDSSPPVVEPLIAIKLWLDKTVMLQEELAGLIEDLPINGKNLKCSNMSLLVLKATAKAVVQSLEQCYSILKRKQISITHPEELSLPPGAAVMWINSNQNSRS